MECLGVNLIIKSITKALNVLRNRESAAQLALFAMLFQALIPLSSAIPLPGSHDQAREGQDIPGFYLVVCTAYGAQSLGQTKEQPLDGGHVPKMPWDCPVCQVHPGIQGPIPKAPQMAFVPRYLPHAGVTPVESARVAGLWTAAPKTARAPPLV